MFIPGSVGRLTGWKAVVAAIVIVGLIGVGAWQKFQPRSFGKGTWQIAPGDALVYSMKANDRATLRAEFAPQGVSGNVSSYTVWVVDEANKAKLNGSRSDPQAVQKVAAVSGTGPEVISQLSLDAGTYYLIAQNTGKQPLSLRYELYEIHK